MPRNLAYAELRNAAEMMGSIELMRLTSTAYAVYADAHRRPLDETLLDVAADILIARRLGKLPAF